MLHRTRWQRLLQGAMAAWLAVGLFGPPADAATVKGMKTGVPASVNHLCPEPDWHSCVDTLTPNPVVYLDGPSQACITAMQRDFPNWTVTYNWTHPWKGAINITDYHAADFSDVAPHEGCIVREVGDDWVGGMGAVLTANFEKDPGDAIHRFRWVQIIDSSKPSMGGPSPYVDPRPNDDTLPFYWRENEYGGRTVYDFHDEPARNCPCYGHVWWRAELYLTDWYQKPGGATTDTYLIIYDGIRWGFDITCVPLPGACWAGMVLIGLVVTATRRRAA